MHIMQTLASKSTTSANNTCKNYLIAEIIMLNKSSSRKLASCGCCVDAETKSGRKLHALFTHHLRCKNLRPLPASVSTPVGQSPLNTLCYLMHFHHKSQS